MTPTEFASAIAALGWSQVEAAKQLDVDDRTVRRWAAGDRAIPGPVKVALRCMARLHERGDKLGG
jgi:ribosome-binding protein aMBF1 (putative translation factor)